MNTVNLASKMMNSLIKMVDVSFVENEEKKLAEKATLTNLYMTTLKKEFENVEFDVIIGNPPYQIVDGGGTGDSARPIYNDFIEKAKEMNPKYISMIIPSRWMKGGKGLSSFRKTMINDKRISHISDHENAKDLFPTIYLDGGVCYFLWNKKHNAKLNYIYHDMKGVVLKSNRFLKNKYTSTVLRDYRQLSIVEKTTREKSFEEIVSLQNPFGFRSYLFNNPERYKDVSLKNEKEDDYSIMYGIEGSKGGYKRACKYINNSSITKGKCSVDKYKLFFSKAYMTTATIPPEIIKGVPGTLSTETFLKIGDFNTESEMNNCLSYIKTKFFRALLFYNRHSLNISKSTFSLIPLQDFSRPWIDEELYKKYKLTQEEIDYIEDNIDPMSTSND